MLDTVSPPANVLQPTLDRLTGEIERVLESLSTDISNWWINPQDYGIGDDPRFAQIGAPNLLNRQGRGELIPAFLSEPQLTWLRKRTRATVINSEIALNAVNQRVNYTFGKGLQYEAVKKHESCPDSLVSDAQAIIDAFNETNGLADIESEAGARVDIDGEAFIRLTPAYHGILSVRFIEPEFVRSPEGDSGAHSFGIMTPINDVVNTQGFWVDDSIEGHSSGPLSFLSLPEVLHIKFPETPSTSKRGLSAFYPIESTLRGAEDLLNSTVSMVKARAKIAWLHKLAGTTSSLAAAMVNNQADATLTDRATGRTTTMERYGYGTIVRMGANDDIVMPSANVNANDHVGIMQMILRMIASRFSMPEYLLSADASNANYSNTMVAESPFVRAMERLQEFYIRWFGGNRWPGRRQSLIWRQLTYAVTCGLLPANIYRMIDIQVSAPSLVVRNRNEEATVNKTYHDMGVKSIKTIRMEQNLDHDIEEKNLSDEKASSGVSNSVGLGSSGSNGNGIGNHQGLQGLRIGEPEEEA